MIDPIVSVRITTYNQEDYIGKCLDSIICQKTNFPFEIVVGEDCSTDNTAKILNDYQKKHPEIIHVIYSEKNIGPYLNGFRTTRNCRGKYIALCDGDDYWLTEDKLQRQVDFLEKNPEYGLVYGDLELVDANNNTIEASEYFTERRKSYASGEIFWNLLEKNFINLSSVCYLKESIKDILDQTEEEDLKHWFIVDYYLWLTISQRFQIKFIDQKLAAYRTHDQNLTMKNDFLSKRNPLIIYSICSKLQYNRINTREKKDIFIKKLIYISLNKHAQINHRLVSFLKLITYPHTYKFIVEKLLGS